MKPKDYQPTNDELREEATNESNWALFWEEQDRENGRKLPIDFCGYCQGPCQKVFSHFIG